MKELKEISKEEKKRIQEQVNEEFKKMSWRDKFRKVSLPVLIFSGIFIICGLGYPILFHLTNLDQGFSITNIIISFGAVSVGITTFDNNIKDKMYFQRIKEIS